MVERLWEKKSPHIPLGRAFLWIALSTLLISGSAFIGWKQFQARQEEMRADPRYHIVALLQVCSGKEPLQTAYLAELLNLSADKPTNLYRFNCRQAEEKLLQSPLIRTAEVKKIWPGTIRIDYAIREPIALLIDYTNTAVDCEGIPFPFTPFFTPKNLPEIYLGLGEEEPFAWGKKIADRRLPVALYLQEFIIKECCSRHPAALKRLDVSRAFANSYSQREVVAKIEEQSERDKNILCVAPRLLRFTLENYTQALANYLTLRNYLQKQEKKEPAEAGATILRAAETIIDLRLPQLAFFSKEE